MSSIPELRNASATTPVSDSEPWISQAAREKAAGTIQVGLAIIFLVFQRGHLTPFRERIGDIGLVENFRASVLTPPQDGRRSATTAPNGRIG